MKKPDWNTLVTEFGRLIGADGLEIDSAGACRLELGDGPSFLKPDSSSVHLMSSVVNLRLDS